MSDILERLWAKVERGRVSECWPWTGNAAGQICVHFGEVPVLAKVLVYEEAHGKLPKNTRVRNTCKTDNCMNPRHLTTEKRRRFSEAEVRLIHRLLDQEVTQAEIAQRLDCTQEAISYTKNKRKRS